MNRFTKKIISGTVLLTMATYTMPIFAFTNEETIYSKLKSDGEEYKTIVSTTVENEDGDTETNQVESDKELPVDCKIIYELDGKEISADEIAGKSGKIKITLQYTNKSKNLLKVNGKDETMYTPFVVVAGTIIDNENNTNVEITNGKVINDGSKTIVVGMAMPGMQESLGLSEDDINIPDSIEIKMDSKNFEMGNIMSYCTPKLLDEDIDFSKLDELFDKVDELQSAIDKIQDGSIELRDGANTLSTGTTTFAQKSETFNNYMNQLSSGVSTLNSNYATLDAGISSASAGLSKVQEGITSLSNATTAVQTSVNAADTIVNSIDSINVSISSDANELAEYNTAIIAGNTASIQVLNSAISTIDTTIESYEAQKQDAEPEAIAQIDYGIGVLNGQKAALSAQISELNNINASLVEKSNTGAQGSTTTKIDNSQALTTLKANISSAKLGLSGISTGLATVSSGVSELQNGTTQLINGSNEVKNGISTLNSSASQLASSSGQLLEASKTISNGATALENGTNTLADGIKEFNDEGIKKISNEVNGTVKNTIDRVKILEDLANDYNTFSSDEERDGIKFISIINSIKNSAQESKDEEAIINSDSTDVKVDLKEDNDK